MQIPVAVPPNLDPAIAKQVIEYLKANPDAAQQSYEQANRMLQTPGMAQMMLDAKVGCETAFRGPVELHACSTAAVYACEACAKLSHISWL